MCRIESYNVIFPDGRSETREQIVNCPRGTPSAPCHRREYVNLFRDRQATQEDLDDYARRHAPVITPPRQSDFEPREPQRSSLVRRKKHRGVLGGLSIELKLWNPFSSKEKDKKKMAVQSSRRPDHRVNIVERMPQAPMPPPAWEPRDGLEPNIIEAIPQKQLKEARGREQKTRKHRKHRPKPIVHQEISRSDSSSEEDTSPSPQPTRKHHRQRPRTPSPATRAAIEAEKTSRYEKQRADRNAEAQKEARIRAQKEHDDEIRREDRRIAHEERLRLESEEHKQRAEEQQRRQYEEDRRLLHPRSEARDRPPYSPTRPRRDVAIHNPTPTFEESGDSYLDSLVEDARRRQSQDGSHNARRGPSGHGNGHSRPR